MLEASIIVLCAGFGLWSAGHYDGGHISNRWIHPMAIVCMGVIGLHSYLFTDSLIFAAGIMMVGNIFFQMPISYDHSGKFINPEESWFFDMHLGSLSWRHPKPLWIPPSFPGYWRILQVAIGAGLVIHYHLTRH